MKELKCPHCQSVFQVDDAKFESIAQQVRTAELEAEVTRRVKAAELQFKADQSVRTMKAQQEADRKLAARDELLQKSRAEVALLREQVQSIADKTTLELGNVIAQRDAEIARLRQELDQSSQRAEADRKLALLESSKEAGEQLAKRDADILQLNSQLEAERLAAEVQLANLKERHAQVVNEKNEQIQHLRDLKARMSTKMLGETLEIHCQTVFSNAQSMGMFPNAYFAKDNDARSGTKGDFIFRDYVDGHEYISIMFEMKNEADGTVTRHRNEDFLEKLHKDRTEKNCEYAVLVSLLERDNEHYNEGIVNKSHRFPKMYVIRPQMFLTLISLLCQTSQKNMAEITRLRNELIEARQQSIDVSRFEERRDKFVATFSKLVESHVAKHNQAMEGIDKVIESLEKQVEQLRKVKTIFETSEKKLLRANDTVESDFTIKKLTHGNPTMRARFEQARLDRANGSIADDPGDNEE